MSDGVLFCPVRYVVGWLLVPIWQRVRGVLGIWVAFWLGGHKALLV
jgi:hypothetical protein